DVVDGRKILWRAGGCGGRGGRRDRRRRTALAGQRYAKRRMGNPQFRDPLLPAQKPCEREGDVNAVRLETTLGIRLAAVKERNVAKRDRRRRPEAHGGSAAQMQLVPGCSFEPRLQRADQKIRRYADNEQKRATKQY